MRKRTEAEWRKPEVSDNEAVAANEEAAKARANANKVNWLAVMQEPDFCDSEIKVKIDSFEIKVKQGFDGLLFLQVGRALLSKR